MGTRWRGLLAPIDKPTGDGRRMAPGAISHRELPLPLKWQRQDEEGHDASVVIGLMDAVTVDEKAGEVWGEGELFDDPRPDLPRLAEDVGEAKLLLEKKCIGPSVDAGAAEAALVVAGTGEEPTEDEWDQIMTGADGAPDLEVLFTQYEIAAATLVPIPAFGECRPFELLAAAVTAAVSGATDLPVADREMEWDGAAAAGRVFDLCADGDDVDAACVARAFLWRDPDGDPAAKSSYKLGFADVINGQLRIVPRGVAACAGGRGVDAADIPADDKQAIKSRICTLYGKVRAVHDDWPECPFDMMDESASASADVVAALSAAAATVPAAWFDDPGLDGPTPITVTDDGRIFGHAAAWGTCHAEFRDVCVAAPHSVTGYAHFHRHTVDTDGGRLAAGRLTTGHGRLGTGCTCCRGKDDHACTRASLSAAVAHYDRARTLAHVRAGEDEHGIWIAGALATDLDEQDRAVLARRLVSGDWREVGGQLELVEVLALATERPGFPLPRTSLSAGRQRALVAAGAVRPVQVSPSPARLAIDYRLLGREVAAALRATAGTSAAFTAPDPDPLPAPPDDGRAGQVAALAAEVEAAAAEDRARQAAALAAELAGVA